ncbi:hypothetical protein K458DRAFT_392791 [Lentithecium fluviatile CBS 122367]|uniref:Uncharacterized protein n=1 Tax=Lentithecium fluviatile CBS 122367 TaxID=1168545 RepID=A0A6G1IQF1_9PLEO|nr:hypothetical protein K458DRAFT_392791 [Lentithecium fluviatile CBS 122367]
MASTKKLLDTSNTFLVGHAERYRGAFNAYIDATQPVGKRYQYFCIPKTFPPQSVFVCTEKYGIQLLAYLDEGQNSKWFCVARPTLRGELMKLAKASTSWGEKKIRVGGFWFTFTQFDEGGHTEILLKEEFVVRASWSDNIHAVGDVVDSVEDKERFEKQVRQKSDYNTQEADNASDKLRIEIAASFA